MGGDDAPAATVAGAVAASRQWGIDVVLVGAAQALTAELDSLGATLPIVEAPDVIEMDEEPMAAVRAKRGCSIRVACQLVADGEAGAVVSAGSTGATLAAALLTLGRVEGVRRPVVAAVVPLSSGSQVVLADAGGSLDVHPEAFPGYAAMASAYAEALGMQRPRIGLLNVGEEEGKGNALAKGAYELLAAGEDFVGNVEPAAVFDGAADVVVTDGFTGNIFLKTIEATASVSDGESDSSALLLGIAGEVLVAHGAASADDVARALRRGAQVAEAGLAKQVGRRMARAQENGPQAAKR
jgi:glycerol-3-phosphate acyltransferase PlsX